MGDLVHRDAGHHGHHAGDVVFGDIINQVDGAFLPFVLRVFEVFHQTLLFVAQAGRVFETLLLDHQVLFLTRFFDVFFQLKQTRRNGDVAQVHAGAGFIQRVDGFVRKETIRDVAVGEFHAGQDRLIRILHAVVLLVLAFDFSQDFEGVFGGGRIDHDCLETALQSPILLDVLAVFVQGGGADGLHITPRESGFEHVGCIQRAAGSAGTDDGVKLIDEQNHIRRFFELVHHGFHALFELSAVFRAGHERRQIQGNHAFVKQDAAHFALHDAQGQALGDGRLAHAGLADQHRIVLLAAAQHLGHALDFLFATHDRIEFAFLGQFGQIAAEIVKDRGFGLFHLAFSCGCGCGCGFCGGCARFGRQIRSLGLVFLARRTPG